jgi:outer membrane immunogenic protein
MHKHFAGTCAGAFLGLLLLAAPAAADGPFSWTGLYLGAHGGYAWGEWNGNMIYTPATGGDGFDAGSKTIDSEGALAGGQIGFNVQSGSFVWGIEGDFSWSGVEGEKLLLPYPANSGSPAWDFESTVDWLATVRGRLGFANGPILLYATGGVAFADVSARLDLVGIGYGGYGEKSETRTGYAVGGGLEWALSRNWGLKAEYLYVNLGEFGGVLPGMQTTSCDPACPHTTDGFKGDLELHTIRAGLNYKFN